MSGDNSDTDANLPTAAQCDARCKEFAEITGTDSALAMYYLQDRDWDVQRGVNAFFEETSDGRDELHNVKPHDGISAAKPQTASITEVDPEPHRIRVISWNIDGLDRNNIESRCTEACKVILREKPDVVFLQEVVMTTFNIIEELCNTYLPIPGDRDNYFTTVLLKTSTVKYMEHTVIPFSSSAMCRNLLKVQAEVKGVACTLMTSHLESTRECSEERKRQLRKAFHEVCEARPAHTVIFGGDLNLRDKEIAEIGGLPENVLDLWEITGKRPEAKFTWDMSRNDNLEIGSGKNKPKCRFDRVYLRHGSDIKLKPVYFELIGLERITHCHRFASDHWGILTHFDKT